MKTIDLIETINGRRQKNDLQKMSQQQHTDYK